MHFYGLCQSAARSARAGLLLCLLAPAVTAQESDCDAACLEDIAEQYLGAYLAHDPARAPFSDEPRYTENNVLMPFPEGTWDTVTEEPGPALILSDPESGNIGIFTAIIQNDTPGFLAVRLAVEEGEIHEIEHVVSTRSIS